MWFIPLNENGETIDYFYRCGTQLEMEEALAGWLRSQITRIERQQMSGTESLPGEHHSENCSEISDPDGNAELGAA
jgi:hypothetical protein